MRPSEAATCLTGPSQRRVAGFQNPEAPVSAFINESCARSVLAALFAFALHALTPPPLLGTECEPGGGNYHALTPQDILKKIARIQNKSGKTNQKSESEWR